MNGPLLISGETDWIACTENDAESLGSRKDEEKEKEESQENQVW